MSATLFGWVLVLATLAGLCLCGWCFYAFVICPEVAAREDWEIDEMERALREERQTREPMNREVEL